MTGSFLLHDLQIHVPPYFLCPISLELMQDPVTLSSGQTFDRSSIETWLDDGHSSCPVTRQPIDPDLEEPIPNHALRRMIQSWCVQNKSFGIERILTPRLQPSLKDIPGLLDRIRNGTSLAAAGDDAGALHQLCKLASDRPKARQVLLHHGAMQLLTLLLSRSLPVWRKRPNSGRIPNTATKLTSEVHDTLRLLAALLEESSQYPWEFKAMEEVFVLAEIISDATADDQMNLELRQNAAVVLSRASDLSDSLRRTVGAMAGFMAGVVRLMREAPAPASTLGAYHYSKAGMRLMMAICEGSTRNRVLATEAGVVEAVASLLGGICQDNMYENGAENMAMIRIIELGLKVWESVCKCADGRSATWPFQGVVVGYMSGISDKATKHSLRIVWLLLKWAPAGSNVPRLAAEQGAFLKAMAITQTNASVRTRALARKVAKALSAFVIIHSQINLE